MTTVAPAFDPERLMAFAGRMFGAAGGMLELLTVYLGERLGYYRALADRGPVTSSELATATGTHERYAREWLEAQAVCGILAVEDAGRPAQERRYALPPEHAVALLERESLAYVAPMGRLLPSLAGALRPLLEAFRSGGGVPYECYGAEFREGQQDFTRPHYVNGLDGIVASLPEVDARLRAGARVVDVACGAGIFCVELARRYPNAQIEGIDLDEGSIDMARANAREAGLDDRLRFHVRDAASPGLDGPYDLIAINDSLHHVARPVDALRAMRALLAPGGTVLVVENRTAEHFHAPLPEGDFERFSYLMSVVHCLPTAMAEQPSAGLGAIVREDALRSLAAQAGFASVSVAPIEHEMVRFYVLTG
jgi:2-polyprenyl-3-methyl-5-hydroxy-6-metoxy-1,4-benzoquinol methylase